jgi:hypothetical protein
MGMSKIFFLKSFFFLLVLNGCNYKSSDSKFGVSREIYVEVVQNDTLAPQIGAFLSKKIRDQIIRRGHFEIVSDINDSEFLLTVSLSDYKKDTEIYNPQDTILAAGFRMNVHAIVSFSKRDGEVLIKDTTVTENASVLRDESFSVPSDRQALLSLSESLGQQISQLIENYRW